MPIDYSKIPTEDLEALAGGDLTKVSTGTLEYLSQPSDIKTVESPGLAKHGLDLEGYEPKRKKSPKEMVPEWGRKNPNLYGAYGAAKSLITPTAELAGGFAGGILGSPLVGSSIGMGMGKKSGEMATRGIEELMGERPEYPSFGEEVGKSVVDVGSALALGKGMDIAGKVLYGTENKLSSVIREGIDKAIRPSIKGKGTFPKAEAYYGRAETAVKAIIDNKPNLKLTKPNGEPAEQLPRTLKQFGQAINQTKQSVFEKYDAMAKQSNESGVQIPLDDIVSELRKIAKDKAVNMAAPGSAQYASQMADIYEGYAKTSPLEAQNAIAMINSRREAFYANPSYENATNAYVDSMVANRLRKSLDKTIEQSAGEGYQELKNVYGALSTIEDDVNKRAIVDARKNIKGLIDFSDIFSGSSVVHGIISLNPATVASGVTAKGISKYIKHINNPNRIVKNLFTDADKIVTKTGTPGPISSVTPQVKAAEPAPYDFQGNQGWKIDERKIMPSGTTQRPARAGEAIPGESYAPGVPPSFTQRGALRPDQLSHIRPVDSREMRLADTIAELEGKTVAQPAAVPRESYAPGVPEKMSRAGGLRPDQLSHIRPVAGREVRLEDTIAEMSKKPKPARTDMADDAYSPGKPEKFPREGKLTPEQKARMRQVNEATRKEVGVEDIASELKNKAHPVKGEIPADSYKSEKPPSFTKLGTLRPDQQAHVRKVDEATQREVGIEDTVKEMAASAERAKATAQGILKAEFPGMDSQITKVIKEEPEITRIIKQSKGKPTKQDMGRIKGLALKKINEFRVKKGLKPIEIND